ncbi:MAG: hypothetical protein ISS70_05650 [Phycisphaerae bacterium]|nr:hypothetical protein [Phycisphaerae bacterium]
MEEPRQGRKMRDVCIVVALLLAMGSAGWAADCDTVQQYKMQSVLEYSGKTQFSNKAETVFTAKKQLLSDGKASYVISADDAVSSPKELSFVIDQKTQHLSGIDKDLALMEKVTNQCLRSLTQVTKSNVGKTWKQAFDLSSVGNSLPGELKFTLTAIPLETESHGELIAVRALSEPFFVKTAGGAVQCRINCAYVFDSDFEDIFLSASVFSGATNANGYAEKLKHTVTTWKVDAAGEPASFSELGKDNDFEKLVSKLGLTSSLTVVKDAPLPQWARAEGVRAAQVANICAAVSCEGALNPVATICLPAASTVGLQSVSKSVTASTLLPAASGAQGKAASGGTGGTGGPFGFLGWNWPTAAWGTGIGFGVAGVAGAWDDTDTRVLSPSTPSGRLE